MSSSQLASAGVGDPRSDDPAGAPTPRKCAIWTEGLSKVYRRGVRRRSVLALDELTLVVRSGEIFGFLGPNGAGKSTTIKLLTGLILPTRGRAVIGGAPAGSDRARGRIGFLPENPALNPVFTVRETLDFGARLLGLRGRDGAREVSRLMECLDLGAIGDRKVGKISKGQAQLVGIGQALIGSPPLYILDEPMSGLDPMARKRVRDMLLDLRRQGRSVFLSSHILSDVEMLCDRVGVISGGRMLAIHDVAEIHAAGPGQVELVISGVSEDVARNLSPHVSGLRFIGRRLVIELDGRAGVEETLQACLQAGARVHALSGRGGDLEAVVLAELSTSPPGHARFESHESGRLIAGGNR